MSCLTAWVTCTGIREKTGSLRPLPSSLTSITAPQRGSVFHPRSASLVLFPLALLAQPHPLNLLCIIFTFPRLEMCSMRCALCVNASSFVTREA